MNKDNKTDTFIYYAGLETQRANIEEQLFYNLPRTRIPINKLFYPGSKFSPSSTDNKNWSVLAPKMKIGPAILLKVDSGDRFDVFVEGFFQNQSTFKAGLDKSGRSEIISSVLSILQALSIGIDPLGNKLLLKDSKSFDVLGTLKILKKDEKSDLAKYPSLNWITLDTLLQIETNPVMGFLKVTEPGKMNTLAKKDIAIKKNGYILVFLSNESNRSVYFDNLVLKQYKPSSPLSQYSASYIITETGINITTEANSNLITEN